jgi:uncharacterized iron-regulated protein
MKRFVQAAAVAAALFSGATQAETLDLALFSDLDAITKTIADEFSEKVISTAQNVALIAQTAADGNAYIAQTGETNFAGITQITDTSAAVIFQTGSGNRAYIAQ